MWATIEKLRIRLGSVMETANDTVASAARGICACGAPADGSAKGPRTVRLIPRFAYAPAAEGSSSPSLGDSFRRELDCRRGLLRRPPFPFRGGGAWPSRPAVSYQVPSGHRDLATMASSGGAPSAR